LEFKAAPGNEKIKFIPLFLLCYERIVKNSVIRYLVFIRKLLFSDEYAQTSAFSVQGNPLKDNLLADC
jgi:hypothetical protein